MGDIIFLMGLSLFRTKLPAYVIISKSDQILVRDSTIFSDIVFPSASGIKNVQAIFVYLGHAWTWSFAFHAIGDSFFLLTSQPTNSVLAVNMFAPRCHVFSPFLSFLHSILFQSRLQPFTSKLVCIIWASVIFRINLSNWRMYADQQRTVLALPGLS